jgi:hypothetical protein
MTRDELLCKLAAEAMQRLNAAWPTATPEQKIIWDSDLRIFIQASRSTADEVNKILRWHRMDRLSFPKALAKARIRKRAGLLP